MTKGQTENIAYSAQSNSILSLFLSAEANVNPLYVIQLKFNICHFINRSLIIKLIKRE